MKPVKKLPVSKRRRVLWPPVAGPGGLYHGDTSQYLRKFDLDVLQEVWREKTGNLWVVRAFEDVVLVRAHDGTRRGYRSEDGREIWRLETGINWRVWRDKLLVAKGSRIEILDIRTGQQVDKLDVGREVAFRAIWGDLLILSDADTLDDTRGGDPFSLYDLQTRRVIWQRDLLAEIQERYGVTSRFPAVGLELGSEGRYVATYGLHTFGGLIEDGRITWCSPEDSLYAWPEVHGGRVFMLSSDKKDFFVTHFVALDEATGRTIYDVSLAEHSPPLPKKLGRATQPLVLEGHLAYPTESGFLIAFRESDGQPAWHYRHGDSLFRGVVAGRRAFVPAADGDILVFEEEDPVSGGAEDDARVQKLVVRSATAGLEDVHVVITASGAESQKRAIAESFEAVVRDHLGRREFSGEVVFVVYGGMPQTMGQAEASLMERIATQHLETVGKRSVRVRLVQKPSGL